MEYLLYILRNKLTFEIMEEVPLDDSDRPDLAAILPLVLAKRTTTVEGRVPRRRDDEAAT